MAVSTQANKPVRAPEDLEASQQNSSPMHALRKLAGEITRPTDGPSALIPKISSSLTVCILLEAPRVRENAEVSVSNSLLR